MQVFQDPKRRNLYHNRAQSGQSLQVLSCRPCYGDQAPWRVFLLLPPTVKITKVRFQAVLAVMNAEKQIMHFHSIINPINLKPYVSQPTDSEARV